MRRIPHVPIVLVTLITAAALAVVGCTTSSPSTKSPEPQAESPAVSSSAAQSDEDEDHGHKPGAHGGIIDSLGRDSYHVEAIVEKNGALRLYTLGQDESRVIDIEAQNLVAYVKPDGATDSVQIEVRPQPQPGDAEGKASVFVGQLPEEAISRSVDITIPNITIGGERFRLGFSTHTQTHGGESMPQGAEGEEARALYLTPGGIYTEADIAANGNMTADQKFKGAMASHDLKPKVGDKLCPITLTKANPKFSWIVGGKTYEFCCPPCVDEFVAMAKSNPEEIKEPEAYVKQPAQSATEAK
jgi:hypothetical protein